MLGLPNQQWDIMLNTLKPGRWVDSFPPSYPNCSCSYLAHSVTCWKTIIAQKIQNHVAGLTIFRAEQSSHDLVHHAVPGEVLRGTEARNQKCDNQNLLQKAPIIWTNMPASAPARESVESQLQTCSRSSLPSAFHSLK